MADPSKEAKAIEDEAMEPTFITLIMLSFIGLFQFKIVQGY